MARFACPANVARRAGVTPEEAELAIASFIAPDPNSSDPDNEGRRIERVPGGYLILNAVKYRKVFTRMIEREQSRSRVAKYRAKSDSVTPCNAPVTPCNADVTVGNDLVTQSEAETVTETEKPPVVPQGGRGDPDGQRAETRPVRPKRDNLPTTDTARRIAALFGRQPKTKWLDKEIRAYRDLGEIETADLVLVESYYTAERKKPDGVHRRDLGTFLNNFAGELDRARAATQPARNGPRIVT